MWQVHVYIPSSGQHILPNWHMIVKRVFIAAYGRFGILSTMYRE